MKFTQQIEALGGMLFWYRKDLAFFWAFQQVDKDRSTRDSYCAGSFQQFINAYQVARTLKVGETLALFDICLKWHDDQQWMNVSRLAKEIHKTEIVHGFPLSLASKVMYLMHPEEVLPFDRRAKNALGITDDKPNYKDYHQKALVFGEQHKALLEAGLSSISGFLDTLESEYLGLLHVSFPKLRYMRLLDRLLWTMG